MIEMDGQPVLNFGANDYLGLAGDERLAEAARRAIDEAGVGAAASPLLAGYTHWHARLESRLAEFCGAEAALLFSSGYAANVGAIAALVGPGDVIFSDARNHASIIDGCRLSRAEVQVYRHADVARLQSLLTETPTRGRRLIVTDSVFSMDGDAAPLVEIAALAEQCGAMLMVDEAHATGVYGARGSGMAEQLGVASRVDVHVGTLSKALGASGGFVAGSRRLIDWLIHRARSYLFSTAPPAAIAAAALAALDVVAHEPERRARLLRQAARLRDRLSGQGWNTGRSTTPIVPVVIGDAGRTMGLSRAAREAGLYVPGIRPPSVPPGQSLLRISVSAAHDDSAVDRLLDAMQALRAADG
jgi:8-amino-7-oxononanoate synthase